LSFSTNEPFTASRRDKVLGFIILITIGFGVYWYEAKTSVMDEQRWLPSQAFLSESYGISKDAPIRLAGVTVGKVASIKLTSDGKVKLELLLDKEYDRFFHADSSLKLDSQIGINSVIVGSNLLFAPGESTVKLTPGATIKVTEPKSVEQLLEEFNIVGFAEKATNILDNLDNITGSISNNQQALQATIDNVAITSQLLVESSQQVPEILHASVKVLEEVNKSIQNLDPKVTASMDNLNQSLKISQQLMLDMQILVNTVNRVADLTPDTLDATNATLTEVRRLTKQLRGHWLLDTEEKAQSASSPITIMYPPDLSLYQTEQVIDKPTNTN
jgi:phospholipid/cholesterol/gamma-HCH transport system substrate-binding protein